MAGTTLGRVTISRNRSDKILHKRPDCHEDSVRYEQVGATAPRTGVVMATVKETRERLASTDERWYALDQAEVPGRLGVVLDSGLSADEAAERLRLTGIWH